MQRKIIRQGRDGNTIYLPKLWVEKSQLKPGDEIEIEEVGATLVLKKKNRKRTSKITVTEQNAHNLKNVLTHLYRGGTTVILIEGLDNYLVQQVEKVTKDLLSGFEVITMNENEYKTAEISHLESTNYDTFLRKIFLVIKETQVLLLKDAKNTDFNHMEDIENLRTRQDRYILICKKILAEGTTHHQSIFSWELLTYLMHIEHAHYYLYKYAYENDPQITENILELLEVAQDYFNQYYDAYYKKDLKYVHNLNKLKHVFQFGKCHEYLHDATGAETVVLSYIREILRLIQIGTSPILTNSLQENICEEAPIP